MADHQREAGAARRPDDFFAFLNSRGDGFLDQNMNAARDAGEGDVAVKMGGRRDGHRIDAAVKQFFDGSERRATERPADEMRLLAIWICNAGELDAGKLR